MLTVRMQTVIRHSTMRYWTASRRRQLCYCTRTHLSFAFYSVAYCLDHREKGADPTIADNEGHSPKSIASESFSVLIAEAMEKRLVLAVCANGNG